MLAGHDGSLTYSIDNVGNVNPSSRTVTDPARNGSTIRLTIDQSLQFMAQHYLDQVVPESGAKDGELAVLDAHTGQVLALAASGTFDAANPNTIDPNSPIDPPVMSAFEPGSVQKAITFAAAMQERKIKPQTVISVPSSIHMGGVTISDAWWHPTEKFTATGILAESSNVGTLKIAQRLGPTVWDRYEKLFGVGKKTGIELPGESAGYLPPMKDWSASTFANLPFGQGESMTVLQLASIYQTIANDGVRIPPRIISLDDRTGRHGDHAAAARRRAGGHPADGRDGAHDARVGDAARRHRHEGGHPRLRIAGKTGTAQQPDPKHGGAYSSWMNWDTFAGIAPADDPQFVVAIMVDNPAHGVEGGDVAAPLFNEIASYELQHAQIPPTGVDCRSTCRWRCATASTAGTHPLTSADVVAAPSVSGVPRPGAGAAAWRCPGCRPTAGPGGARTRRATSRSPASPRAAAFVRPGDLFAGAARPLRPRRAFAAQALAAGAVAVLTDAAGGRTRCRPRAGAGRPRRAWPCSARVRGRLRTGRARR